MKIYFIRKTVLKNAGTLLIATLMVLSTIVVTAGTTNKGKGTVFLWEGFESGVMPPTGWTTTNDPPRWYIDSSAFSGSYCAKYYEPTGPFSDDLISPVMDLTGVSQLVLSFWLKIPASTTHDGLMVQVSTDGINWDTVASYSNEVPNWEHELIDLSAYAGYSNVRIGFYAAPGHGPGIYLDEIRISDTIGATEFMGLEVAPLGLAELAIIDGRLSVSNCISGMNKTDGVAVDFDTNFNQFDLVFENPFRYGPLPGGMHLQCLSSCDGSTVNNYGINEEGIKAAPDAWDSTVCFPGSLKSSSAATVEAFNGNTLVFYREHIAMEVTGDENLLHIGSTKRNCDLFSYHSDLSPLSFGCSYSAPVEWTWSEQGVGNLSINRIKVIPEDLNGTFIPYKNCCIYVTNIPAFNLTEMYVTSNNQTSVPTIDGPASGKILTKYDYKIRNSDIDSLYYFVDWGDGSDIVFVGPYAPGTEATVSHTWLIKGTYVVRAKAMDEQYSESDWATLEVTMPRARIVNQPFPLLKLLFERFPNAFPVLQHLIGL